MFARVSCSQCNHQHCPHTFPFYVVNDQLQLCIHPCSEDVNRQWQQCWYRIPIHIVNPEDVLSHVQITSNHMGRDLESGVDVPSPTSPTVAPDFALRKAMRCCIVMEQNDTTLKQFWLTTAKGAPQVTLQECAVILAIDCRTYWHGMVKNKSISAEVHGVHDFQSILTAPCSFLPRWHLGTHFIIRGGFLQPRVKWMHPWLYGR